MASPAQQLPPGWTAEWDVDNQRHMFLETATGRAQWEHPLAARVSSPPQSPGIGSPARNTTSPPPLLGHHTKRRQYALGQTHAYDASDPLSSAPPGTNLPYPDAQAPGPQLFTPAIGAVDNQFAAQQQQAQQPAPYYGHGQQSQPEYINAPGYGQAVNQFSQMSINAPAGPAISRVATTLNLQSTPPDPSSLLLPPPPINLPPNASILPPSPAHPHTNAHFSYQRCTLNAIPTSNSLLNKSKLPLALVMTPYRSVKEDEEPVPVIKDMVIGRCKRCRMYINPYVTFIDGGHRWRCCMCNMQNETPQLFDWDSTTNKPADRWARPELNHSVVDFLAPQEYWTRPPQPVIYVFLIDVSYGAIQSGMTATAAQALLENLDRIPNEDSHTKIALIGFDTSLYFFSMPPGTTDPELLVVSDIDDPFLPKPTDLVVGLTEARASLEVLLGGFYAMFAGNMVQGSALGSALRAAYMLMSPTELKYPVGGKIVVLTCTLPSVGPGALKNREDPKILGTSKESSLMQVNGPWYKTFAIECSRAYISVDMFLFPVPSPSSRPTLPNSSSSSTSTYLDLTTLSCLPHYTSGQTYYYGPTFSASSPSSSSSAEDIQKFTSEFSAVLATPFMVEAITRVRATRGIRLSSFHGNFFVRSTDLLAMPTVPHDTSYTIELEIEEELTKPYVVIQTGILHTTHAGDRAIRVVTLALPTTSSLAEVWRGADEGAIVTWLANKGVERTGTHSLESARDLVQGKVVEMLQAYAKSMVGGGGAGGGLGVPENLKMLPALVLGMLKNPALRQSAQIPPDVRAYAQVLFTSLPTELLIPYIHPNFYSLHDMPPEAGSPGPTGKPLLPPRLPLSSEKFERHGLYLIEDGQGMYLWVGRDAVPQLMIDVFGFPDYGVLRSGKTTLPPLDNPFSRRICALITHIRSTLRHGVYHPHLYVVKEDGDDQALKMRALSAMVYDRNESALPSYVQWVGQLRDKVNGSGSY